MPIIRSSRLYVCYCRLWCEVLGCWLSGSGAGQQEMRPGRGMLHFCLPMFLVSAHRDNCTFYLYSSHAPIRFCANSHGSVREHNILMTVLTSCELSLYHSAGAVSCDCVAVWNLLLALSEIWKLWLWRAWKIMLNCTWWIHITVTTTGTLELPSL